jgi:hypothetical protein
MHSISSIENVLRCLRVRAAGRSVPNASRLPAPLVPVLQHILDDEVRDVLPADCLQARAERLSPVHALRVAVGEPCRPDDNDVRERPRGARPHGPVVGDELVRRGRILRVEPGATGRVRHDPLERELVPQRAAQHGAVDGAVRERQRRAAVLAEPRARDDDEPRLAPGLAQGRGHRRQHVEDAAGADVRRVDREPVQTEADLRGACGLGRSACAGSRIGEARTDAEEDEVEGAFLAALRCLGPNAAHVALDERVALDEAHLAELDVWPYRHVFVEAGRVAEEEGDDVTAL